MQVPTLVGIIPYAAINFSVYETLKQKLPEIEWLQNERGDPVVAAKLACGAVAGGVGQTVVYPLDTVRRRMQVLAGLGFRCLRVWGLGFRVLLIPSAAACSACG